MTRVRRSALILLMLAAWVGFPAQGAALDGFEASAIYSAAEMPLAPQLQDKLRWEHGREGLVSKTSNDDLGIDLNARNRIRKIEDAADFTFVDQDALPFEARFLLDANYIYVDRAGKERDFTLYAVVGVDKHGRLIGRGLGYRLGESEPFFPESDLLQCMLDVIGGKVTETTITISPESTGASR